MNAALIYLWLSLLKGRFWRFARGLRRPTTLIGFAALAVLFAFLVMNRRHAWVGHLVERRCLIGGGLLMGCASLFKGFLQRGLEFELPDVQFIFTSPFTRRQVICYRLFSNYLFAFGQGLVFLVLFGTHFEHPLVAALSLVLFQGLCFHLSAAASIYAGAISAEKHHRIKCMMLGVFIVLTALYLRAAWDLRLAPSWLGSSIASLLFYPAATIPDALRSPFLHEWLVGAAGSHTSSLGEVWKDVLWLGAFAGAAGASFWWLLRLRGDLFEPALGSTARQAERRRRLERGTAVGSMEVPGGGSFKLPRFACFRGVGAIFWKHLVVARRSKRSLWIVGGFAVLYTGFTTALLFLWHHYSKKAGAAGPPPQEAEAFHLGIALFLASLTLFLQRMLPFDLRRDGHHLPDLRLLPVSAFAVAMVEIITPAALCVALQAPCIVALVWYAPFTWTFSLLIVLCYPAVALGLNAVWNLYYFLTAARRGKGANGSPSAVGSVLVVALSFLVFYPALWAALKCGHYLNGPMAIRAAIGAGLGIQLVVDALLVLLLAGLLSRYEVSRELA